LSTKEREAFLALALLRQCFFIFGLCWQVMFCKHHRGGGELNEVIKRA